MATRTWLAVLTMVAIPLIGAGCAPGASQGWEAAAPDAVGEERAAEHSELDAAVRNAVAALTDSPMIEAGQVTHQEGRHVESTWVRFVNEDTYEVVRHGGPGDGEVLMQVAVDGQLYVAAAGDSPLDWNGPGALPSAPHPWKVDLDRMRAGGYVEDGEASEAAVQDTADGGRVWTLPFSDPSSSGAQRWTVSPEGILRGYEFEHPGAGPDPTPQTFRYRFVPHDDAVAIRTPELGTPGDPARFDVWEDLPLPNGQGE